MALLTGHLVEFSLVSIGEWGDSIRITGGGSNLLIALLLAHDDFVNFLEHGFDLLGVFRQILVDGDVALGSSVHFSEHLQVSLELVSHN